MRKPLSVISLVVSVVISGQATAGFIIEYPAAVTTSERDLMSNRTHYEQRGEARFRMNDASGKPAQSEYEAAGAKMVVDLGYRVVIHRGTANNEQRVRGFADNVPLRNAMALVLPQGWQVYQDAALTDQRMADAVSFEGNLKWTDALVSIGDVYGYQFEVNWNDRVVKVSEGRPVATAGAGKIRIIDEPEVDAVTGKAVTGKAVRKGWFGRMTASTDSAAAGQAKNTANAGTDKAQTFGVPTSKPIDTSDKAALAAAVKRNNELVAAKPGAASGSAANLAKPVAKSAVKPVVKKVVSEPSVTLQVEQGTLFANVERLSKQHGWKAPRWSIDGDFRVPTNYSVTGKTFEEAIFKLLSIHPLEAEINRTQKIVYVHRELH